MHSKSTQPNSARLSKSNSFVDKKPILKKRSMSELMLQRSLSTSSLVKQAAAAVQAQQNQGILRVGGRPGLERSTTDYLTFPFSSRRISRSNTGVHSASSSGVGTPGCERKHIHFNEQVVQCIAIDVKGEEDDDELETSRLAYDSDDSDDGGIVMKKSSLKKRRPMIRRSKSSAASVEGSKTIAMLPSTTLKYREDTPEPPPETAMKHSTSYRSPAISPSSSQETLKPSKPSRKFSLADSDNEDEDEDEGPTMSFRSSSNKMGSSSSSGGLKRSISTNSLSAEPAGMRRTASGMFMPYEEGEEEPRSTSDGLFGRVIDTVNTARDIAHVIWNVGWRK